jgi:ParB family chromosome partitioning protein
LLALGSAAEQEALAARIVLKGLSVREAERLVKPPRSSSASEDPRKVNRKNSDPNVNAAELKLKRKLGAPVKINLTKRGGSILIKFSTIDDLSRIFDILIERSKA